jgi:hypothetical protein
LTAAGARALRWWWLILFFARNAPLDALIPPYLLVNRMSLLSLLPLLPIGRHGACLGAPPLEELLLQNTWCFVQDIINHLILYTPRGCGSIHGICRTRQMLELICVPESWLSSKVLSATNTEDSNWNSPIAGQRPIQNWNGAAAKSPLTLFTNYQRLAP